MGTAGVPMHSGSSGQKGELGLPNTIGCHTAKVLTD